MSKQQLLKIANVNIFPNTLEQVTFLLGKGADGELNKVMASFSGWDKEEQIDVKGLFQTYGKDKTQYIRIAIALGEGQDRSFYNGALFINKKKREGSNQPDYTGQLDLTKTPNGPVLQLAAWHKEGRESGKPFISMNITENTGGAKAAPATPVAEQEKVPAADASKAVPMESDEVPF